MTEVKLTDEQAAQLIEKDEQRWAMAQMINEVGEYAAASANRLQAALRAAGYDAETREQFMGCMSLVVSIAKSNKMSIEEVGKFLHVLYRGVNAAIEERVPASVEPRPGEVVLPDKLR